MCLSSHDGSNRLNLHRPHLSARSPGTSTRSTPPRLHHHNQPHPPSTRLFRTPSRHKSPGVYRVLYEQTVSPQVSDRTHISPRQCEQGKRASIQTVLNARKARVSGRCPAACLAALAALAEAATPETSAVVGKPATRKYSKGDVTTGRASKPGLFAFCIANQSRFSVVKSSGLNHCF